MPARSRLAPLLWTLFLLFSLRVTGQALVASFDVEFLPGLAKKWGLLGLLNMTDTPAGRSAGSLFWAGLPNCYFWVDRDRGDTGVLFTQVLPFADPQVLAIFDEFETAVHRR